MEPSRVIEPVASFGAELSLLWVIVVGALSGVPFVLAVWRFLSYRGRAMRAESMAKTSPPLEAGAALIHGRVETDDGGPAIRVEIDQVGREWTHKNGRSHEWKERNRVVQVRPFHVRTPEDELVLVAPAEDIRLVDSLETEKVDGNYRRRVAELSNREEVWVSGVLSQEGERGGTATAYRSGPGSWVIRGGRGEPMEIASGGLERQFSYWRAFYRKATIGLGIVAAIVQLALFSSYYALGLFGKVETAQITGATTYTTTSKGKTYTHYVVHGVVESRKLGRVELKDEVSYGLYTEAKSGRLREAPFLVLPQEPWLHALGSRATLPIWRGMCALLAGFLGALIYALTRRQMMPWYEQKKVLERSGGSLASKAWWAQEPGKPGLFVPRPSHPEAENARPGAAKRK